MNFRTTLILLALLAGLGAAFWGGRQAGWMVQDFQSPDNASPTQDIRLVTGANPTSIQIQKTGSTEQVVYRRTVTGWDQVEPVWYPLAKPMASEMVAAFTAARGEVVPVIEDRGDDDETRPTLQSLRLDPPVATVTVRTDAGDEVIRIGEELLTGVGYAWTPERGAVLVPSKLHDFALHTNPATLRDRRLPTPLPEAITRLAVLRDGRYAFELERLQDGSWWVIGNGVGSAGDRMRIDAMMNTLLQPAVARFISVDEGTGQEQGDASSPDFGLDESANRRLELRTWDASLDAAGLETEPTRIRFGRAADLAGGLMFAQAFDGHGRTGPVMQVRRGGLLDALDKAADHYRQRRFADIDIADLRSVTLHTPSGTEGNTLQAQPGRRFPAWVDGLLAAEADSFIPGFASSDPPVMTIRLEWGITRSLTVRIFRRDGRYIAVREGESVGMTMDSAVIDAAMNASAD
jgi:hypothetical protein